jgi:hypothetical protein
MQRHALVGPLEGLGHGPVEIGDGGAHRIAREAPPGDVAAKRASSRYGKELHELVNWSGLEHIAPPQRLNLLGLLRRVDRCQPAFKFLRQVRQCSGAASGVTERFENLDAFGRGAVSEKDLEGVGHIAL